MNNRKNFSLFILLCLAIQNLNAQLISCPHQQIQEGYITIDLGIRAKGSSQVVDIEILNSGNQALILSRLELSCDCLSIEQAIAGKTINPSEKIVLKLKHSGDYAGDFQLSANLYSNAQNLPIFWIKLEGRIIDSVTPKEKKKKCTAFKNKKNAS